MQRGGVWKMAKPRKTKKVVTEVKRGDILQGVSFEGDEVVRGVFVVVQFANGVDERIELDQQVTQIIEEES